MQSIATAYAADDLAAVMRALELGKVDLYGDSYGTFFVQEFVARLPFLLVNASRRSPAGPAR